MSERKSLLLGAGNCRLKKICLPGNEAWAGELVTIDTNPDCGASLVWDLERRPLPFPDESFDEIHAYDCLEHWGRQGDWRAWFDEMAEYHRLLKPGGQFATGVPVGADHFADPGHTRFFAENHFRFLSQRFYEDQLKAKLPFTDYRWYWKRDFHILVLKPLGEPAHHLAVMLEKQ